MPLFFVRHIPNTITCCNLVSGCVATLFAVAGNIEMALTFIVIGAVFDFFDGFAARLLRVSSPIGKELDSLADVVTFGVVPATIVYHTFQTLISGLDGTLAVLLPYAAYLIAAFSALRLAKFNLDTRQTTSFIGLPTPANALFWGAFIIGFGDMFQNQSWAVWLILALTLLSSMVLVAEIPMFALKFKYFGVKENALRYFFLLTSALIILFLQVKGLALVIVWYILLSVFTQRKNNA